MLDMAWDAIVTGAGLFWRAAWALALGYAVSAAIQVFVSRRAAAQRLGDGGPAQLTLAALLGFVSSSCSFAALSATRSLWTKGAALTSALAFMFASTNLAVEVAALAFIFLGWQYALALFAGAPILIAVMAVLVRFSRPDRLAKSAEERAEQVSGMDMDAAGELPERFSDRARDERAYQNMGLAYFAEWRMVYKELVVGFLIAGAVAALVPASFFEAIFPQGDAWYVLPLQILLAPVLAVLTVIGSMGNGPLAAILAEHGIMFGAIMAFLYSDFVVPPALKINARYYGWTFAAYLGLIFAVAAVITGAAIHGLFTVIGLVPDGARSVEEMATFAIDYTFWLNLTSVAVVAVMYSLARRAKARSRANAHA